MMISSQRHPQASRGIPPGVCPFHHARPDGFAPGGAPDPDMTAIDRLREYASKPVEKTDSCPVPNSLGTTPPPPEVWPSPTEIQAVLEGAVHNPQESVRSGVKAQHFDESVRREITTFQERKAEAEGCPMSRLVHREQLHGGAAEVHWNPHMNELLQLFDKDRQSGLVRISDASAARNPDGKSMYGFALELYGTDNQPTDILMTGGTPRTEASQAKDPEAQLALFNMLNPPSKLGGLARIVRDVGLLDGPKMLLDVARMRTELSSVSDLTAWSRAPFALRGRDGTEYVVKMRVVPTGDAPPGQATGETSSEKLESGFRSTLQQGEARWRLQFQFMQPGDEPEDARETWKGPWLTAAEVVLPRTTDASNADRLAKVAEETKFTPWKGKTPGSDSPDREILRPWGELNRARLAAYQASQGNRS